MSGMHTASHRATGRATSRAVGLGFLILFSLLGGAAAQNAVQTRTNVSVTITPFNPPITISDEGGNFAYTLAVENGEPTPLSFDIWTVIILPGGGGEQIGYGPVAVLLPGGWSAQDDLTQAIPGGMPDGTYTYTTKAGLYPDGEWASDSFEFEKLPGQAGWYAQSPGTDQDLAAVSFVDASHGWAVSTFQEIIHTTDGGDIWLPQDDGQYYPQHYEDIQFIDAQTGWVVGHGSLGGIILHTIDGGATWVEQEPDGDLDLIAGTFVDADNGWAVGGHTDVFGGHTRTIQHTADGGTTWHEQLWQSEYPLQAVFFTDTGHGWVVGGPGGILFTNNGGSSWNGQNAGTVSYLQDVYFLNASTGWCVGDGGTVRHTTDGGAHWQAQSTGSLADFKAVVFVDALNGWIAGVDNSIQQAVILRTGDGGQSWEIQDPGTGSNYVTISSLSFVDANHGWAAGTLWPDSPVMLHTSNGGVLETTGLDDPGQQGAPEQASVSAPFPNPFNPRTSIRFRVTGQQSQPVMVGIYDLRGQRIRTLDNGLQVPGEHVASWDGLTDSGKPATSGVYMYSVTVGDHARSGKLTLLR